MYQTSLYFKFKNTSDSDKQKILEMFFKAWVDDTCNNEVGYALMRDYLHDDYKTTPVIETFRVDFERMEDAVALKLKGVPDEFQNYLEIVD